MSTAAHPLHFHPTVGSQSLTARVKQLAIEHGLAIAAVTTADPFPDVAEHLVAHIAKGHMAGMDWFTEERARFSCDVRNLHPTARSILAVAISYWPGPTEKPDDGVPRGRISRYAWGSDYHKILKRRLKALHAAIETDIGHSVEARRLVDTARIVERAVAARAGLGWYGKHSCLITPGHGSWILLGELVLDLELEPDAPLTQDCGRCTICLDRCPTGAIIAPYTIHAPACTSFQTIENRGVIPREIRPLMGDWVYGCDVCQEVCPYTKASRAEADPDLQPRSLDNAYPSLHWLLRMTPDEFGAVYHGTPVPRTKRRGLARNAAIALGNIGTESDLPALVAALIGHDEPLVRGHAAWALGRIGTQTGRDALDRARSREPDDWVVGEMMSALADIEGR